MEDEVASVSAVCRGAPGTSSRTEGDDTQKTESLLSTPLPQENLRENKVRIVSLPSEGGLWRPTLMVERGETVGHLVYRRGTVTHLVY